MTLLLMFAQINCSINDTMNTLNMQCVDTQNRHATQPRPLGISPAGKTGNRWKVPYVSLYPSCFSDVFV